MPFLIERHFLLQPTLSYICEMNENLDPNSNRLNPEDPAPEKK